MLPVERGANAASLGTDALCVDTIAGSLRRGARRARRTGSVVHAQTDQLVPSLSTNASWDVPVAELAALRSTRAARKTVYEQRKRNERMYLSTPERT